MKYALLFTIVLFAGSAFGQTSNNYCAYNLCSGLQHIACNNPGDYGYRCSSDAAALDLRGHRTAILHRHNTYRNEIAGGNNPRFQSAVRMATMVWDDELEYLAYLNVIRCENDHDECRNTDRFRNSGQSLAWRWDPSGQVPGTREAVLWAIDYWYSEHETTHPSLIDSFYPGTGNEHFTVMVAEKNVAAGCAALQYRENGGTYTYVACNYATTNIIDRPIYRCGPTASLCQQGRNPEYPNLCEITETYNVNNSEQW